MPRSLPPIGALMVGAVLAAAAARPAIAAGSAAEGHSLAQRWCSSCHAVDQESVGKGGAPPFVLIAKRHPNDHRWTRAWLMAPHPAMPDFNLSRRDIDNIVAYLDSLAPAK